MTNLNLDNINYISAVSHSKLNRANVYWQPNKYCNYECSYCWPGSHTKVKDFDNAEKGYKLIDSLSSQFYDMGIKSINWGWSGGEATFHPNFLDFQERILSHIIPDKFWMTFNMTSNMSQSLKWWDKFLEKTDKYKFRSITASLHQEYVYTDKQIKLFEKKLQLLKDANVVISINQVMDIDFFDDQLVLLNDFIDKGFDASAKINTVENQLYYKYGNGKTGYTKEQMDYMINENQRKSNGASCLVKTKDGNEHYFDHVERLKPLNLYHHLHDWMCTAGYLSVTIKKGKVRRGVGGCANHILGDLGDDIKLFDKPTKCSMPAEQSCSCVADLKLPKWREDAVIIAKG